MNATGLECDNLASGAAALPGIDALRPVTEALRQRGEELAALRAFGRAVSATLSPEQTTVAGLELLWTAVRPDLAFLFLREGERLVLKHCLPASGRDRLRAVPDHCVGECLCGQAVREKSPVYSPDIRSDSRCASTGCVEAGLRSFAALPLLGGEDVLGVIGLGSDEPRSFEAQAGFLEVLASQVAAAMTHARLLETAQRELAERQRTEAELRRIAARLEESQRVARLGHYEFEVPTGLWTSSAMLDEVFGIGPDRPRTVELWQELVHPDDRAEMVAYFRQEVLAGRQPFDREYRIVRPNDGMVRWVHGLGELACDDAGRPGLMFGTIQDITERRQVEEALRRGEQKYRELVENSNSIILRWNSHGEVTFLNEFGQRFFGYTEAEILGRNVVGTLVPETESTGRGLRTLMEQITADPATFANNVNENTRRDGSRVWVAWTNKAVFGPGSQTAEVFSVGTDITGLKRTEEALLQSEEKFRALFDHGREPVFILDRDGRFLDANRAACEHLRCSREGLLCLTLQDIDAAGQAVPAREHLGQALARGHHLFESAHRRCDGTVVPVEVSVQTFQHRGRVLAFSLCRDLTDRRRSERLQRAMLHIASGVLTTHNLDELFHSIHTTVGGLMPARNFFIALEDEAAEAIRFPYITDESGADGTPIKPGRGLTGHVLRTGEPLLVDRAKYEQLVRSGEVERIGAPPVDWLGVPLKTPRGATIGVMALQTYTENVRLTEADRDVLVFVSTQVAMAIERKQGEEALRQARADLEQAQAVAHVGSWVSGATPEGPLVWSAETCRIFGLSEDAFDGRKGTFYGLVHPADVELVRAAAAAALRGQKSYELEHRIVRHDGSTRWVYERAEIERDAAGNPVRMVGVVQDITDRKHLEAELRQSQKMEAVGRLAGGVAHDFNNILAATLMQLSLLQGNPSLDPKARELVAELERGAQRSADLTRQLLLFGRRSFMQFKTVDLDDLLADLHKMLRRLLGEHIQFEVIGQAGLPRIYADPGMIQQVVVNLCVNARDAMPRGGRLSVRTSVVNLTARHIRGTPGARDGRFVSLAIADSGSGMDPATLQHIFEPFFTTKEVGRGTGLGLATVHGIVQQHKGWVDVTSTVGQGTTFRVFLPAHGEPADPITDPPPAETITGGGETILLVEDEQAVRQTVARLLRQWGYRVVEAPNGLEAEARGREQRNAVDLLFTDLVMPGGLGGMELAERLRQEEPALQVILSSGYSADLAQHGQPMVPGVTFLPKPWLPATLAAEIRRSLDRRTRPAVPVNGAPARVPGPLVNL